MADKSGGRVNAAAGESLRLEFSTTGHRFGRRDGAQTCFPILWVMLSVIASGCGQIATTAASSTSQINTAASAQRPPIVLTHDFGVVAPNSRLTHPFAIRNSDSQPWTFRQFGTSCVCTVASATAPVIQPDAEESVEVVFKAPGNRGDYQKAVEVYFQEGEAPRISLLWGRKKVTATNGT